MSIDQWVVTVAGVALIAGLLVFFFGRRPSNVDSGGGAGRATDTRPGRRPERAARTEPGGRDRPA